ARPTRNHSTLLPRGRDWTVVPYPMIDWSVPPQNTPCHSTRETPGRAAVITRSSAASEPSGSFAAMNSSTDWSVGRIEGESVMGPTYARALMTSAVRGRTLRMGAMDAETPPALTRPLRTDRLTLRPATRADADATWAYRRLDGVSRWLTSRPDDAEEYREHFADPARLAVTAVIQLGHDPAGPVIGDLMLRREDAWGQREVEDQAVGTQAEIGWSLHPPHTGHGYATEAVRELLRVAFEDHGLRRVVANCFYDNEPSWR